MLVGDVPRLFAAKGDAETVATTADTQTKILSISFIGLILLSIILMFSLKIVWALYSMLQLIIMI